MGPAKKPDHKQRLGYLTGLRLCEAIEREFPELSRWKVIKILAIVLENMQRSVAKTIRHEEFRTTRCARPSFADHQVNYKIRR